MSPKFHPGFGVDHAVAREVLAALVRDTLDRLLRLHHRNRVREPAEIEGERARRRARVERRTELGGIGRRKIAIALVASDLDDRRGPQPAVEMIVEEDLRSRAQRLERDHGVTLACDPA